MNLSTRQIIVIIITVVLLVSGIGVYGLFLQDSGQSPTDDTNGEQNPTDTPTTTPTPEYSNFSSFTQEQTQNGYTMNIALSDDAQFSYDQMIVRVNRTVNYTISYDDVTESSLDVRQSTFEMNGTRYSGFNVDGPVSFGHLPEGTTITVYHNNTSDGNYTQVEQHTITGHDMNYNVTIEVSNLNESLDGIAVYTAFDSEAQTITPENNTVTLTNITTSRTIMFGAWVDKSGDGELQARHMQIEMYQPTLTYFNRGFFTHQAQHSNTYELENATITIISEEHKEA